MACGYRHTTEAREFVVRHLLDYRLFVAREIRGDRLKPEERGTRRSTMNSLGLPLYALARDVRAVLAWRSVDERRRLELAWEYPHLFDNAEDWAERRVAVMDRRLLPIGPQPGDDDDDA